MKFVDRIIGSGHWFGLSVRLILFVVAVSGATGAYFFGPYRYLKDTTILTYNWLGFEGHEVIVLCISTAVAFVIALWSQMSYYRIKAKHKECRRIILNYMNNNAAFLLMARNNMGCDRELFDTFMKMISYMHEKLRDLSQRDPIREVLRDYIHHALLVAEGNVKETIEKATLLFNGICNSNCAVCVKLIDYDEGDIKNLRIKTYMRDEVSNDKRGHYDDEVTSIRNNTADRFIFTEVNGRFRNRIYAEDDLVTLHAARLYDNERSGWEQDYTATIVCGIGNLRADRQIPWAGLFCVDNKSGGLKNEIAEHYASELSYRLSVMLYRVELLQEWLVLGERS